MLLKYQRHLSFLKENVSKKLSVHNLVLVYVIPVTF